MKKCFFLFLFFCWSLFVCSANNLFALNLRDIPPDLLQKNSDMIKKFQSQNIAVDNGSDKNKNLSFVEPKRETEDLYGNQMISKVQESEELGGVSFKKLALFGESIFRNTVSTTSDQNIAVSDDYIIGPADRLELYLWGRITDSIQMTVQEDGSIFSQRFGKLQVGGKPLGEIKKIFKGLIEGMEGVSGDIIVGSTRSVRVMVLGEVVDPGFYTVSSLSSVSTAIAKSGGVRRTANLRKIEIRRQDKMIAKLDLYDLAIYGRAFDNIYLQPNDVIFVPQSEKQVYVAGEVGREAIYELKDKENLEDVLKMAGGLNPTAYGNKIKVKRFIENKGVKIFDVSIKDAGKFNLMDGDKIFVIPISSPEENIVYLKGNVYFPGSYAIDGNTTVADIIGSTDNLRPNTATSYSYIKRYYGLGKNSEIISFNLEKALMDRGSSSNIKLKTGDEIHILKRNEIMPEKIVNVKGEVVNPGLYKVEDRLTLEDLLKKAGGLTENADNGSIEVIRKTSRGFVTRFLNYNENGGFGIISQDEVIVHSIYDVEPKKYVEILGEVKRPGKYLLTENLSASELIKKAGGLTDEAYPEDAILLRLNRNDFSYELITFNLVDVLNSKQDLYLKDGDMLQINRWEQFYPRETVKIFGAINKPGDYLYAKGMGLRDLIIMSGNVKDSAYADIVEITRMRVKDGEAKNEVHYVNLKSALSKEMDFPLQPYDSVRIREIKNFNLQESVTVSGEVNLPSEYTISDNETLLSILKRAGGISNRGFIKGLVLKRKSVKKIQAEQLRVLKERLQSTLISVSSQEISNALSKEDIVAQRELQSNLENIIKRLENVEPEGRIVVEISSIEKLETSDYNLLLEEGDEIFIPKKPTTINVLGEVFNPSSFAVIRGQSTVKDYIERTGGITEVGDEKNIYVVKSDGSVISNQYVRNNYWWKDIYSVNLDVGDTIVVPRRLKFPSYMRDIKDITQILYQIATTVAVTKVLF